MIENSRRPFHVSFTKVGLILTKIKVISALQQKSKFNFELKKNTVLESSYGNMSAHIKFQLKAQNQELAVDRYMPPRRTGMHNY